MKSTKTWSWTRWWTLRFENYQPRKQRQEEYTHSDNERKVRGREGGRGGRQGGRKVVFRISLTRMKTELGIKAGSQEPSTAVRSAWNRQTGLHWPREVIKGGGDPEGTKPLRPRAQGTPPNVCPPLPPAPSTRWPPHRVLPVRPHRHLQRPARRGASLSAGPGTFLWISIFKSD